MKGEGVGEIDEILLYKIVMIVLFFFVKELTSNIKNFE